MINIDQLIEERGRESEREKVRGRKWKKVKK